MNQIERMNYHMNQAIEAFQKACRALSTDGPGPVYQMWKFGKLLEQHAPADFESRVEEGE